MTYKKEDFDRAAKRLLGSIYDQLAGCGFTHHDFCREIAQRQFVGTLADHDSASIQVIRTVAERLWNGDGTHGLLENEEKVYNLIYVVGNPAIFTKHTSNASNPLGWTEALEGAEKLASNSWRVPSCATTPYDRKPTACNS